MKRRTKQVVKKPVRSKSTEGGDVLVELSKYPEIMRPAEVQEVLRISRTTFFRMVDAGTLKGAVRVHGSWRCVRDVLRQWLLDESKGGMK